MPPTLSENIKLYRASYNSTTPSNGGFLSTNLCVDEVARNLFPDASDYELQYGATLYRKVFWKIDNRTNSFLIGTSPFISTPTKGDEVVLFLGSASDTQSTITGNERTYGCANLANDINQGVRQFDVKLKFTDVNFFQNGDRIRLGNDLFEEFHNGVIANKQGTTVTVTLAQGDYVKNNHSMRSSYVSTLPPGVLLSCAFSSVSTTTPSGSVIPHLVLTNIGTIDENWTLRFTDPTTFIASGARLGVVGYGNRNENFAPADPVTNEPFFEIPTDNWKGLWGTGDTFKFSTHSSTLPIWFKRVIKPGTSYVSNRFKHAIIGFSF